MTLGASLKSMESLQNGVAAHSGATLFVSIVLYKTNIPRVIAALTELMQTLGVNRTLRVLQAACVFGLDIWEF